MHTFESDVGQDDVVADLFEHSRVIEVLLVTHLLDDSGQELDAVDDQLHKFSKQTRNRNREC